MATVIRRSRIRYILLWIFLISAYALLLISFASPSAGLQFALASLWILVGMLLGHMLIEKLRMKQRSRFVLIAMVCAFGAALLSLAGGVRLQERENTPVPAVEQTPIRTLYA